MGNESSIVEIIVSEGIINTYNEKLNLLKNVNDLNKMFKSKMGSKVIFENEIFINKDSDKSFYLLNGLPYEEFLATLRRGCCDISEDVIDIVKIKYVLKIELNLDRFQGLSSEISSILENTKFYV